MKYSWESPANPAEGYQGTIGKTLKDSKPWWPEPTRAPQGAPNVVVILLRGVSVYCSTGLGGWGCGSVLCSGCCASVSLPGVVLRVS